MSSLALLSGTGAAPACSERALKIVVPIHSFEPGGVERVALRLAAAWRAEGAEAIVVVGHPAGAGESVAGGVDCRALVPREGRPKGMPLARMLAKLPAILRAERPDILFCPGNTYSSVGAAMKLSLGKACPPIVMKVSNDLDRRDMRPVLRFGYHRWLAAHMPRIDHFVAMAPPMAAEISARAGMAPERISVIHDPALTEGELRALAAAGARRRRDPAGRRFLAAGRLVPQKNFARLLGAFSAAAQAGDRLTILGEGPERGALEALVERLGLAGRVTLPGHVIDLVPWFEAADVFVLSSDYEGVPAVIVEALAAGTGIVATRCSAAMSDLLGNGTFGTLVPMADEGALASAIATAPCAQPHPNAALAHARRFTLEDGARAYLDLMERLARAR